MIQVGVNREISRGRFQEPFEIKLGTINSRKEVLLRGRERAEKKGIVGIQGEFQTERAEKL